MADPLRPRLNRLEELSKRVNTVSDEAARIVQAVESHSSNTLHGSAMRIRAASAIVLAVLAMLCVSWHPFAAFLAASEGQRYSTP